MLQGRCEGDMQLIRVFRKVYDVQIMKGDQARFADGFCCLKPSPGTFAVGSSRRLVVCK